MRLLMDPNIPNTVSSLIYIGPPERYKLGTIAINKQNGQVFPAGNAGWNNLLARGLISSGAVLRIGENEAFYTIRVNYRDNNPNNFSPNNVQFFLTKQYNGQQYSGLEYVLQLNPTVLPNQEPRQFPRDVVIDLNNSRLPVSWGTSGAYAPNMDVLFSPQGTVTGLVASTGVLNFVLADAADVAQGLPVGSPNKEGQERVVALRTQTGNISVHFVDPTDNVNNSNGNAGADGNADDPFHFAAIGEVAQ